MSKSIEEVLAKRDDISNFLVHLTRDTENGTARENLLSMLRDLEIKAFNHHCYFSPRLKKEDDVLQENFHVVCFTETPLDKIHHLLDISNRKVELKPYGLVFLKDRVKERRGNPVFYVYDENRPLKRFLMEKYFEFLDFYKSSGGLNDFHTLGAFVNIVKNGHDFHWEREWRVKGSFKFKLHEVFAVIAPEDDHDALRSEIQLEDIEYCLFLDPEWNMQTIIERLSIYMWDDLRHR